MTQKQTKTAPKKAAKAPKKAEKAPKNVEKIAAEGSKKEYIPQRHRASFPKTFMVNESELKRDWFILDATGKTLGRFASEVTKILRGKHKPTFSTFADIGDGVIVINADKIHVTGAKQAQKIYRYHTGAMSGMREVPYATMLARKPEYIIERAVKGMMPKSRLGNAQLKRLRIFADAEHGLEAQKPISVNI